MIQKIERPVIGGAVRGRADRRDQRGGPVFREEQCEAKQQTRNNQQTRNHDIDQRSHPVNTTEERPCNRSAKAKSAPLRALRRPTKLEAGRKKRCLERPLARVPADGQPR